MVLDIEEVLKIIKREVVIDKENSEINWNVVHHSLEASRMALFPHENEAGVFKDIARYGN